MRIYRRRQIREIVPLSDEHIRRLEQAGKFPARFKLVEDSGRNGASPPEAVAALAELVTSLVEWCGLLGRLRECGVEREALPDLAKDAAGQWTGEFNPVALSEEDFLELYQFAY